MVFLSTFQVPSGTVTECSAADKLEEIKRLEFNL